MFNKSKLRIAFAAIAVIFAFSLASNAQTDCSKKTDSEIVDEIYSKLEKKYKDQLNHVNVRIKEGVVTIEGWVAKEKQKKDIQKIVAKIKCVKRVENILKIGASGGCPAGQKPCGDTCIPEAETCNIRSKKV